MILSTLATVSLLTPQGPGTGLLLERAVVVQDRTLEPAVLYRVPEGPEAVTPVPLGQFESRFGPDELLPPTPRPIEFGSFSSGTSRIVVNTLGVADPATADADWGYLYFSLGNVGPNSQQLFLDEVAGPGGIGGDIFTYWIPGSEVPDDFVGITEKARDGLNMGLAGIRGMDQNLAAVGLADDVATIAVSVVDTFYFTINANTLGYAPSSWFAGSPRSSATILKVEWAEISSGVWDWTTPAPHLTFDDLDISQADEITALAIDELDHEVLLGTSTGKQMWVAIYEPDWAAAIYRGPYLSQFGGEFAAVELELDPADVFSGFCYTDPGGDTSEVEKLTRLTFGRPQIDLAIMRPCYEMSVSRGIGAQAANDVVKVYLGGLTCVPFSGSTLGVAIYLNRVQYGMLFVRPQNVSEVVEFVIPVPGNLPPDTLWSISAAAGGIGGPVVTHDFDIWAN